MKYVIPEAMGKAQRVIQSCITEDQLLVAIKFKQLLRKELTDQENCALHGYFLCKIHSMGYPAHVSILREL